jgi:hypothetical protein
VSDDRGATWGTPFTIRTGLHNDDIGYPASVVLDDGRIFTVYYGQNDDVMSILATTWTLAD